MRKSFLLAAVAVLIGWTAQAQVASLYVTSSSSRFSNIQTGLQSQTTSFWSSGIGGGVTFNFLPVGPVKVGFDLRGSTHPGTTGEDTAMAGLRVAFNPPLIRLKPYIQGSGGYVATRTLNASYGTGTYSNEYAAWEICGGIDIPIATFVDLRAVELGGGTGVSIHAIADSPNISLFTVNAGLVFHF
jgi:hypothetical protein